MNIQTFLANILIFLNKTVVPFLLAIATFIFIWNAVRYFILDGSNEESQTKAKSLAFWGISAFVIIVSLWGVVNLVVNGLGFKAARPITPDYMGGKSYLPSSGNDLDPLPDSDNSELAVVRAEDVRSETTTYRDETGEEWIKTNLTNEDLKELEKELDIKTGSISIVSVEETVSGKARITFLDSETGEKSTITRQDAASGIELILEKGDVYAKYTVTADDAGSALIYRPTLGGQDPNPIPFKAKPEIWIDDPTETERWIEEMLEDSVPIG